MLPEKMTKTDLDKPEIPAVGDGATYGVGSDSYPGTVIAVETVAGKTVVTVQDDHHHRVSGWGNDGSLVCSYTPNPDGGRNTWRLEWLPKRERWAWQQIYQDRDTQRWRKSGKPGGVGFGHRRYFMDPSF